uniref:Ferritin light chain n=1 Tax=Myotis lucifugus TaxID=59463 RepID=G1Q5F2_MYOLU
NQCSDHTLFQEMQFSQDNACGKTHYAMEDAMALDRNLHQALFDLHALGSTHTEPHLCDFLPYYFLDEDVKLNKKMGDHLINLRSCLAPRLGWGEYLFESFTLKHN